MFEIDGRGNNRILSTFIDCTSDFKEWITADSWLSGDRVDVFDRFVEPSCAGAASDEPSKIKVIVAFAAIGGNDIEKGECFGFHEVEIFGTDMDMA